MKTVVILFCIAVITWSCNPNSENNSNTENADTVALPETTSSVDTTKSAPVNMDEGMMIMFGGKMMINKNKRTIPMTETVTCSDGCKVHPNGKVEMTDGTSMMMKEGDIIDRDGKLIHPTGKVVDVSDSM